MYKKPMYTALLKKSDGEEKRKKPSTIHRYRQSSLPSQSDPLRIRRVHVPFQHNLVIFPRHAPQYNLIFLQARTTRAPEH